MPVKYLNDSTNKPQEEKKPTKSGFSMFLQKKEPDLIQQKSQLVYNSEIEKELNPRKVAARERTNFVLRFFSILAIFVLLIILANVFGLNEKINSLFQSQIAKKGAIVVTTEFTKTEVFLNDRSIGTTPLDANAITPGDYKLTLKVQENINNFYAPQEIPITIYEGNTTVVKAQPGPTTDSGSYVVITSQNRGSSPFTFIATSVPDNVDLFVEEQKLGQTPFTKNDFTKGTKKIRLSKEGYRDLEIEIDADDQKVINVSAKLYKYVITL